MLVSPRRYEARWTHASDARLRTYRNALRFRHPIADPGTDLQTHVLRRLILLERHDARALGDG